MIEIQAKKEFDMPEAVTEAPRKAVRTTILKDEVPAPPLPNQTALLGMENIGKPDGEWPRGAEDAFDYLRSLKPSDWDVHEVYLYWSAPGERKLRQIAKISESITQDWVRKSFGGSAGGRFTVWVNCIGDPRWRKTTEFEMEGDRIFVGQVVPTGATLPNVPAAQNSELLTILNRVIDRLEKLDPNAQAALDMTTNAYKTSLQTIAGKPEGSAAGGLIETIRFLKELGLLALPGASQNGGILEMIRTMKELGLLAGPAVLSDPVKMIESMGKAMTVLKEIAGTDSEGGDFKTVIAKGVIDALPTFRAMTADIARAAEWNAKATQQQPSQRVAPPPPSSETSPNPQAQPTPGDRPSAITTEPPPPAPEAFNIEGYLWDRVAYMIQEGADGDQIAQFLHFSTAGPAEGDPTKVASLVGHFVNYTPGGLLTLLSTKPDIQKALEGKDSFKIAKQFLEFCKTGELCDDDEEEEESDPPKTPPIA